MTVQAAVQQGTVEQHTLLASAAHSDEIAVQINRIAEEISRFRGGLRRTMWKSLLFFLTPLIVLTFLIALLLPWKDIPMIALGAPLLGVIGHIVVIRCAERQPSRKLIQFAQELAETDDIRAISPLIDAFSLSEALAKDAEKIYAALMDALTPLLLRLRSEDAGQVSKAQCGFLCQHLTRLPGHPEEEMFITLTVQAPRIQAYRSAILQAFARIGGRSVLPTVQGLAWYAPRRSDPARLRLQAEAQACLPELQRRIAEMQPANTLLRASVCPDDAQQTLLRVAQGVQEAPSDQLLRPGSPDS